MKGVCGALLVGLVLVAMGLSSSAEARGREAAGPSLKKLTSARHVATTKATARQLCTILVKVDKLLAEIAKESGGDESGAFSDKSVVLSESVRTLMSRVNALYQLDAMLLQAARDVSLEAGVVHEKFACAEQRAQCPINYSTTCDRLGIPGLKPIARSSPSPECDAEVKADSDPICYREVHAQTLLQVLAFHDDDFLPPCPSSVSETEISPNAEGFSSEWVPVLHTRTRCDYAGAMVEATFEAADLILLQVSGQPKEVRRLSAQLFSKRIVSMLAPLLKKVPPAPVFRSPDWRFVIEPVDPGSSGRLLLTVDFPPPRVPD